MIDPDAGLLRDRAVRLAAERDRALAAAKDLRAVLLTQPGDYATAEAGVAWHHLKDRVLAATAWLEDR